MNRLVHLIGGVFEALCALALWLIVVVLGLGALERNLLSTSVLSYADSLNGYLMGLLVLLGISVALVDNGHVRIDIVLRLVPQAYRRAVDWIFRLLGVCAGLVIAYAGFVLAQQSFRTGRMNYGFVDMPLWLPQSLLVLGGVTFALAFLLVADDTTEVADPDTAIKSEIAPRGVE